MNDTLLKWIPFIFTVLVAIASLAANVGSKSHEVSALQEAMAGQKSTNEIQQEKIEKLQINDAASRQLLMDIKGTLDEVKQDIKDIKRGQKH